MTEEDKRDPWLDRLAEEEWSEIGCKRIRILEEIMGLDPFIDEVIRKMWEACIPRRRPR